MSEPWLLHEILDNTWLYACITNLIWYLGAWLKTCSPPARWGLLDFMSDARLLLLPPSSSFFLLLPRQTSSASSWSQWSSPDLHCQASIAVVVAGPHLPALDRSGPHRTSTGESLSAVGLAGLQPARFGTLWASPDFDRRDSAPWASPDFNRTSTARNKAI